MAEQDPVIREWVDKAKQGDQEAFAELVYLFQDPLYNLCYRMLGESGEAEDAAQEAFLRVYNNLHRYDAARSFKTWLLSIASNHCIDRLRKRRMRLVSLDDEPTAAALALRSKDPLPEDSLMRRERSASIQKLLQMLEPHYRLAVVYRYWYGYSYVEIADETGMTVSAVKSLLHRARRKLADLLEENEVSRLAIPVPIGIHDV